MGEIVSKGALRLGRMGSQFPSEDVGGGSADLLVGLETCTKREGENNVGDRRDHGTPNDPGIR